MSVPSTNSDSSSNQSQTPTTMSDSQYHSAFSVNNLRSIIPITLEMGSEEYLSWADLLENHCLIHNVYEHLKPKTPNASETPSTSSETDSLLWKRLDALVKQWIFGTISKDLLNTIQKPGMTAAQAWERLANIFQDNTGSRAMYLENRFSQIRLNDFPNMSAYCTELKMIADQLANVDCPVSENRLVLRLLGGLNENYETIATIIGQKKPLPSFYDARSDLLLVETRKDEFVHTNTSFIASDDRSQGRGRSTSQSARATGQQQQQGSA